MKVLCITNHYIKIMKNQAGPAQDPWPPKPSRSGPGPTGNSIANTIGNSIGNSIGNTIQKGY